MKIRAICLVAVLGLLSSVTTYAQTCVGNCGTDTPNGVVTSPPIGGPNYSYVSTNGGVTGGGLLPSPLATPSNATNGSTATTVDFTANAGALLQFDFNFITSDGTATYPDFAWAALETTTGTPVALIFSAQTTPTGNTVPGGTLPPLAPGVTLIPPTSAIIPGGPIWDQLGSSSGACYGGPGNGCGYTGWIQEDYNIPTAGTYQLAFGVSNASDDALDTGLAYGGVEVNGTPVGTPEPSTLLMLGSGLLGLAGTLKRKLLS